MYVPYRSYKSYLMETYGEAVYRVGVDAGFSCPNREASGKGGCSYCDQLGASATYIREQEAALAHKGTLLSVHEAEQCISHNLADREESIKKQIARGVSFLRRRYHAEKFILYFQAYSNTYGDNGLLQSLYDYSLQQEHFAELIISTRPDFIT